MNSRVTRPAAHHPPAASEPELGSELSLAQFAAELEAGAVQDLAAARLLCSVLVAELDAGSPARELAENIGSQLALTSRDLARLLRALPSTDPAARDQTPDPHVS